MNCDLARQSIQAQLDGEPFDEEALKSHLSDCAKCQEYRAFFQGMEADFRLEIPAPPQLMTRLFPRKRPWIPMALAVAGLIMIIAPTLTPVEPPGIDAALTWLGPDIEQFE